jgi:hypothetical protein
MELLDPTSERQAVARQGAARVASVAGLTVGLLDISKPRGNVLLDRLEELLSDRGAEVLRFRKPTYTKPAPAGLRYEIRTRCDAVIEALAD